MNFQRTWAMPNSETFNVAPIGNMVKRYLHQSKISIDPFARNKQWATYTNDLNPDTAAEYHLDVLDFLKMLHSKNIRADLVIFDPPYSLHQLKTTYESAGGRMTSDDTGKINRWTQERNIINDILLSNGVVLSFGWSSNGMGRKRNYVLEELMLVAHGAGHCDTICMAERKPTIYNIPL